MDIRERISDEFDNPNFMEELVAESVAHFPPALNAAIDKAAKQLADRAAGMLTLILQEL